MMDSVKPGEVLSFPFPNLNSFFAQDIKLGRIVAMDKFWNPILDTQKLNYFNNITDFCNHWWSELKIEEKHLESSRGVGLSSSISSWIPIDVFFSVKQ